ncbi:hypothetical protein PoB_002139500 [Plakobranchus ocellatus]|uniref:G-protein coupled receptors family 1 profile domain-containing protein n=1 Tax=Plakobranchus ocellatus TaxID=259542 RepID=A0AAV3ZID4_9GAST|nr:hypothetical protein PoB_002139500 [Plakobranchus ocellatus]
MNATTQLDAILLQDVQLISNELYLYIVVMLWSLILILGLHAVIVNILNILTFYTIGLVDSVSACFLCLSVTDVISMITLLYRASTTLYSLISQAGHWVIPCNVLVFRLLYISKDIWAAITAYIAIQNLRVLSSLLTPTAKPKPESEERTKGYALKPGEHNDESKTHNRQIIREIDERLKKRLTKEIRHRSADQHDLCDPRIALNILNLAEPRFTDQGQNRTLFGVTYLLLNVNDCMNAFVNFFVYFRFNDAFRTTVNSLINRAKSQ